VCKPEDTCDRGTQGQETRRDAQREQEGLGSDLDPANKQGQHWQSTVRNGNDSDCLQLVAQSSGFR
jgi:hypothetical protein